MSSTRILIIDPHPLTADSLALLLGQHGDYFTKTVYTYTDVLVIVNEFQPQIIVVNVYHDTIEAGLECCRLCSSASSEHTVIVLADRRLIVEGMLLLDAITAGADNVLIQEELGCTQLLEALADIRAGRNLLDPRQVRQALLAQHGDQPLIPVCSPAIEKLTPREREIAEWIAEGASTSHIASALSISERTVQTHISSILAKLGVRSRLEAVVHIHRWRQSITDRDFTESRF
ncbi:response regulator transcription factor [Kallotenue papyrolyticum]|uniref:response regulator transcription factor n=1 Tax=Kallotenue papyrolyticum TaxID=1325125 RepID=UPI0023EC0DD9|nr:response regulator transcription factor [Kallotenue papyrolyticum]